MRRTLLLLIILTAVTTAGCGSPPATPETFYDNATALGYTIQQTEVKQHDGYVSYDLNVANCPVVLTSRSPEVITLEKVGDQAIVASESGTGRSRAVKITTVRNVQHKILERIINENRTEFGC